MPLLGIFPRDWTLRSPQRLPCTATWTNLRNPGLSESSQTQKTIYCVIPFIGNVQNRHICSDKRHIRACLGPGIKIGIECNGHRNVSGWWNRSKAGWRPRSHSSVSSLQRRWAAHSQQGSVGRGCNTSVTCGVHGVLSKPWLSGKSSPDITLK